MVVHTTRVTACQIPGNLSIHAHAHCPVNFLCTRRVGNPARGFTRMCGLRCRSGAAQLERTVGGRGRIRSRHGVLRSCRISPISAAVKGSSDVDGGHSHRGSPSAFGTEFETSRSSKWPVDHEGGAAAEERQEQNADGLYNVNDTVLHPEANNAVEEEQDLVESLGDGPTKEHIAFNRQKKIKKGGSLGVRKPSRHLSPKICTSRSHIKIAERHDEVPQLEPQPKAETAEDFEYYFPEVGDEVTAVVVSGNEYHVDVDIGSRHLGRMLLKDLRPVDSFRPDEFFWELDDSGTSMPATSLGQVRFLGVRELLQPTYPVLPVGTVLSLEVQGVTWSGRALLSARKIASRIAWERVRQAGSRSCPFDGNLIQEQEEPIEAQSVAWNSDGLIFKIEGLRALLPLSEFLNPPTTSESVQDYLLRPKVGGWKTVLITDVDAGTGRLIVSEKRAWGWSNLRIGCLVGGIVRKVLPFGVDVILTGTSLRAMLHISNISQCYIPDIKSLFTAGEKVKALVTDSGNPRKIGLSTADLESSQGLMLEDKDRVFHEAEKMAAKLDLSLSTYGSCASERNGDTDRCFEEPSPANQHLLDFGDGEMSMSDTFHNEQEQWQ